MVPASDARDRRNRPDDIRDDITGGVGADHPAGPPNDIEADEIAAESAQRGSLRRAWDAQSHGRRIFILVGVALGVLGTIVVVWYALSATVTKPMWRDVSFDVVDDRLTTMRFELTKPTDMTVDCTVIAQETNHGVVGRTVVTVGPTQTPSTVHEVQIKTTTLAVIGTVRTCAERTG